MPYDLQLVQLNTNINGMSLANSFEGFPSSAGNPLFSTLLMSYWMCGPPAASGYTGFAQCWPAFNSASLFSFGITASTYPLPASGRGVQLYRIGYPAYTPFFTADAALPPVNGQLTHFLMSVNTLTQTVQVYANDQPVALTNQNWIPDASLSAPPYYFSLYQSSPINIWAWDVAGVIQAGVFPAIGDIWIANTTQGGSGVIAQFIDLTNVVNRRKFINQDLTPVDLGPTGLNPFGYAPQIYMTVRPGGVPTDILINRGLGGTTYGYAQNPPTFQAPGMCTIAPPPVIAPGGAALAIQDVVGVTVGGAPGGQGCQVFLDWSDDRGAHYGTPVAQPLNKYGYLTIAQWQRLGYARDRVFRLTWQCPQPAALQGAWIRAEPGDS